MEGVTESEREQAEALRRLREPRTDTASLPVPTQRAAVGPSRRGPATGHHDGGGEPRWAAPGLGGVEAGLPRDAETDMLSTAVATLSILVAALLALAFLRRRGLA